MTDTELNEAVARKLGWTLRNGRWDSADCSCDCHDRPVHSCVCARGLPDYCHSIAAAWEIPSHVPLAFALIKYTTGEWKAGFVKRKETVPNDETVAEAATAPRAICEAFLKLE